MGNEVNTPIEGIQTERTFTQEDVNRIIQERLAKEKGKGSEELEKRAAELDKRERRMNAVQKLRDNKLPDYLVDALNMDSDDAFENSMEIIKKMKGESAEGVLIGTGNPIGAVTGRNINLKKDLIQEAFGL